MVRRQWGRVQIIFFPQTFCYVPVPSLYWADAASIGPVQAHVVKFSRLTYENHIVLQTGPILRNIVSKNTQLTGFVTHNIYCTPSYTNTHPRMHCHHSHTD